jgi:hypothetical protein
MNTKVTMQLNETKKAYAIVAFPHPSSVAQQPCPSAACKYISILSVALEYV